jgi:hypothetical protein
MLGTCTLRGVQQKNLFVDEHGREFKLINTWVPPFMKIERFVLLEKRGDDGWYVLRSINLNIFYVE